VAVTSGGNRKRSVTDTTVDRRVRRKSRVVDEAECSRRLASVSAGRHKLVRHTVYPGWRQTMLAFVCQMYSASGTELLAAAVQQVAGRHCMYTHQMAALFCVK